MCTRVTKPKEAWLWGVRHNKTNNAWPIFEPKGAISHFCQNYLSNITDNKQIYSICSIKMCPNYLLSYTTFPSEASAVTPSFVTVTGSVSSALEKMMQLTRHTSHIIPTPEQKSNKTPFRLHRKISSNVKRDGMRLDKHLTQWPHRAMYPKGKMRRIQRPETIAVSGSSRQTLIL